MLSRFSRSAGVVVVFALAAVAVPAASAAPITFEFSGLVTNSNMTGVTAVSLFSGSFTFDDESVDDDETENSGNYLSPAYSFSSFLDLDGVPGGPLVELGTTNGVFVGTYNGLDYDAYLAGGPAPDSEGDTHALYIQGDTNLLPSALLPLTPPSLMNEGLAAAVWQFSSGSVFIQGDLKTLTRSPTSVPEPASLSLLAIGFVSVLAGRTRKALRRPSTR